ncbi:C-type lectin domain family 4 member M-like [Carassius auratus]|uniref:C-type lectin domain family 4 member M-like n=1 Tax=Carassius auratus TaxID=7957 RepID=A0A6P6P1U1_CARAU|nr:C-type lectin domain family 4 member M-like [Carassius auratus]
MLRKENLDKKPQTVTQRESSHLNSQQHVCSSGSDSVKSRSSRAAVVCLVLLCVLLLTAVIVLCVIFTQERQQLLSKNGNLTNEREKLTLKNTNLTNERDQLKWEKNDLQRCLGQVDQCSNSPKWIAYKQSSYYISSEWKNWTESRQVCLQRGADLVIINNKEEQEFITTITSANMLWIGLTDSYKEGDWKWVDGSTLTSSIRSFWGTSEPNGGRNEDCAVSQYSWADNPCHYTFVWICERN